MLTWISENIGTMFVSAVLILIIGLIIFKLIRDRKKGKSSCGCGCSSCPMNGSCHSNK